MSMGYQWQNLLAHPSMPFNLGGICAIGACLEAFSKFAKQSSAVKCLRDSQLSTIPSVSISELDEKQFKHFACTALFAIRILEYKIRTHNTYTH